MTNAEMTKEIARLSVELEHARRDQEAKALYITQLGEDAKGMSRKYDRLCSKSLSECRVYMDAAISLTKLIAHERGKKGELDPDVERFKAERFEEMRNPNRTRT